MFQATTYIVVDKKQEEKSNLRTLVKSVCGFAEKSQGNSTISEMSFSNVSLTWLA
jgi:hypothetical protein